MKSFQHIHLDLVGGIAGDMFIAAFIDACPDLQQPILNSLKSIVPASAGAATLWTDVNGGISAKRFALRDEASNSATAESTTFVYQKNSAVSPVMRTHGHSNETLFINLKNKIEHSELAKSVKTIAIAILSILAKAEAKMHATDIEHVHFHELADWDSLMDVVAAAVILDAVSGATFSFSKLPLGGGLVKTQHGLLPVPAPATAEILQGFDFVDDGVKGERITPTGAALLRYIKDNFASAPSQSKQLVAIGYGAGAKRFKELPNVLRVLAFSQSRDAKTQMHDEFLGVIEFDVDDMTPEEMAISLDYLRKTPGVIDVTVVSARGKKERVVEQIKLLLKPEAMELVKEACFNQTSTLGLRYQTIARTSLHRELLTATYEGNTLVAKSTIRPDARITTKVESDCLNIYPTLTERRSAKYSIEQQSYDKKE